MPEKKQIKKRKDADKQYTWKPEHLFADDTIWEEEYRLCQTRLKEIESFRGTLSKSGLALTECLQVINAVSEKIDRVYVYANLRFHEDSTNSFYQSLSAKADMLVVEYNAAASFVDPEILTIPETTLAQFMADNESLRQYSHYFDSLLRLKAHTLSSSEEELLAKTEELSGASHNIFVMINDADMKFPDIKDKDGREIPLTKGSYTSIMEDKDRELRKHAFRALYQTYANQKNTLAAAYYENVKKDVFYANVRKYSSSLEMALSDDNIPVSVYDTLLDTVHRHLPLLHRYVRLRKRMLSIHDLHMYDLYAPLVSDISWDIPYEQAKKTVTDGLAPLGEEYLQILQEGFSGGWIDVYENVGKRGGAYSWGAYPGHPYVLLNHSDNINSMFTVAHEMGHALHSYLTWRKQPYHYGGHKIFVAEVASTVNESLLMQHLLKNVTDSKKELYLLNYHMEQFRGTLFRQTMFAEFEKITHEMVENGQPLNCDILNRIYHDLNRTYYGSDIEIDSEIDIEWARIPHFYNAFYVYQYATGYSAAITLSEKILQEGGRAVQDYLSFLEKGNSEYSIDLLKGAGVDMTSSQPVEKAMQVFESLLDKMESLIEKQQ